MRIEVGPQQTKAQASEMNTCVLLVGLQIGATSMQNSVEISQKTKNRYTKDTAILLLGIYLNR